MPISSDCSSTCPSGSADAATRADRGTDSTSTCGTTRAAASLREGNWATSSRTGRPSRWPTPSGSTAWSPVRERDDVRRLQRVPDHPRGHRLGGAGAGQPVEQPRVLGRPPDRLPDATARVARRTGPRSHRRLDGPADLLLRRRPLPHRPRRPWPIRSGRSIGRGRARRKHATSRIGRHRRTPVEGGGVVHSTFGEKLLIPVLAKLCSFVPDGGVWMNTQRPEWNDANNALAGYGLSMVTACQLRRHLDLLRSIYRRSDGSIAFSTATAEWLRSTEKVLRSEHGLLDAATIDDADRGRVLERLVRAFDARRATPFGRPDAPIDRAEVAAFRPRDRVARSRDRRELPGRRALPRLQPPRHRRRRHRGQRLPEMLEGQVAVLSAGLRPRGRRRPPRPAVRFGPLPGRPRDVHPPAARADPIDPRQGRRASGDGRGPSPARSPARLGRSTTRRTRRLRDRPVRELPRERPGRLVDPRDDGRRTGPGGGCRPGSRRRPRFLRGDLRPPRVHRSVGRHVRLRRHRLHVLAHGREAAGRGRRVRPGRGTDAVDQAVVDRLRSSYRRVRDGLGFRMDAERFGALPIDAYSHSDGRAAPSSPG